MTPASAHSTRQPDLAGGLLLGRARFHLSYRVLVRTYGLLADRELAGRLPAAAASVAIDAALFLQLRGSDAEHLWPRLAADCLDVAHWAAATSSDSDHPTLIAVPLAIEAGARHGARALGLPLAVAGAAAVARGLQGRRTSPMYLLWPTAGVLAGIATARNATRQDDATLADQAVRAEALAGSAYVAGENEVAMGADSIVDLLTRTEPLIGVLEDIAAPAGDRIGSGRSETGTARALSAWKAELATVTAGQAAYLGTLLARWERARSGHDLSHDLVLHLEAGAGTTVVSGAQARWLTDQLDELDLSGHQTVVVPDLVTPGEAFVLAVGEHRLAVPSDPEPPVLAYEHAPVLLSLGVLWSAVAAHPSNEGAGRAVVPGVVGSVALALWAHTRVRRRAPAVDARMVAALVGLSALHGAAVAARQRSTHDARGLPLFPQLGGPITSLVLLVAQRTPRRVDRSLATGLGLIAAATLPGFAVARARGPVRLGQVAVASLNLASWWACMWGADDDLERHREQLVAKARLTAARRERTARNEGRRRVRDLVATAYLDSRRRLDVVEQRASDAADPERSVLLAEASRRLDLAERLIADLHDEVPPTGPAEDDDG